MARVLSIISDNKENALDYVTNPDNLPKRDTCFADYNSFDTKDEEFYFSFFYPIDLIYTVVEQINTQFSNIKAIIEVVSNFYEERTEDTTSWGVKKVRKYLKSPNENTTHTQLVTLTVKLDGKYSNESKCALKILMAQFIRMLGTDYQLIFEKVTTLPSDEEINRDCIESIIKLTNKLNDKSYAQYGNWCSEIITTEHFLLLDNIDLTNSITTTSSRFSNSFGISSLIKTINRYGE